jgi:hypothetical protein
MKKETFGFIFQRSPIMDKNIFLGFKLPENIGYEVYPAHVSFYKKNKFDEWNPIGYIQVPYYAQNLDWWEIELNKILDKA